MSGFLSSLLEYFLQFIGFLCCFELTVFVGWVANGATRDDVKLYSTIGLAVFAMTLLGFLVSVLIGAI